MEVTVVLPGVVGTVFITKNKKSTDTFLRQFVVEEYKHKVQEHFKVRKAVTPMDG